MDRKIVAVVTGAAQGIGRELALGLANQGFDVACVDIQGCESTLESLASFESSSAGFVCNIGEEEEVRETLKRVSRDMGRIGVLVNNAAIYDGLQLTPAEKLHVEEWDRVMAVNVRGTFLCCKWAIPGMKEAGAGKIVNIASGAALRGSPFLLHYVSSKGAIVALTRALATELGPANIQVNAVAPGFIQTEASRKLDKEGRIRQATIDQQSLKRALQPADVVGTVLYLASPWSDVVTGQVLCVDGGLVKN
ncbi:SDR family oxidoreductase [Acidobacteria bacterium AH-259-D05]|nr:SDR family oxidoreductase [Acidobacteria bacterium AH-259-D05]